MKTILLALAALVCLIPAAASAAGSDSAQAIEAVQKMEGATLAKLYQERPDTRREIADAVGYAVFSSGELAIIWISAGYGHGVAHNNKSGQDIYMQMAKAGVGLGLGAKDFDVVFVFHDMDSFEKFTTTGLDLTATADAAAQSGRKGDSASGGLDVLPGVRIYQLTDTGLMAQAMIQGTKFWRDDELNDHAGGVSLKESSSTTTTTTRN
jgi:lipid-binding SYLF domain-containing protein